MDTKKKEAIMGCTSFDELLNAEYGERGTETRERYEAEATKIGTKKSYISKIENGHADVQLSTLFRIFAGLGRRVSLTVL